MRSGSLQKLTKNAEIIQHRIPNKWTSPFNESIVTPIMMALVPIMNVIKTGA
jgi:hypothetical protein